MSSTLQFRKNEPLSKHTTLHVGGPAKYFIEVTSEAEIMEALDFAKNNKLPFFILGGGSNTLADDNGFAGLVIKIKNNDFKIDGEEVTIGAGYITALAARKIGEAGLTGFEWAVTLPGTIGGAVFGNAGCFGSETSDVVKSVTVFDSKKATSYKLPATSCAFGYRNSVFKTKPAIILSVTLKLKTGDKEKIKTAMQQFLDTRKNKQPLNASSAGCMFKNYEIKSGEKFNFAVPAEFIKSGKIPAGWLVEQAGGKNLICGQAGISDKHGNFLLNNGQATASEIKNLIMQVQTRVKDKFGLGLEMEVRMM